VTHPARKSSFESKKQPETQRTKTVAKVKPMDPPSLSELFWTFSDFIRLYSTQPANKTNPKHKKQLKTQKTKTAQRTVNNRFGTQ
jgi:hypothetical protein